MQFHVRTIEAKLIANSSADEDVSFVLALINSTDNEVLIMVFPRKGGRFDV